MGRPRKDVSAARSADAVGAVPESLWREFVELGLVPYEARALVALLAFGAGKAPEIAQLAGVPRTSMYLTLEALCTKGLAERLPGDGPTMWAAPGGDEVLDRLRAAQAERLRAHEARIERVREMLVESLPSSPAAPLPYVHVVRRAAQVKRIYDAMLRNAQSELVMFTRPPYVSMAVNPVVLDTLARGVRARVLYQADKVGEPAAQGWLRAYHDAGVEARLVADMPLKLVVVDRREALVAMADPALAQDYPTTLHVEHAGYAALHANAFEQSWAEAQPFVPSPAAEEDVA